MQCYEELAEALTAYVSRSAEKMRRQGLATAAAVVMLTTNKHRPQDAQYYANRRYGRDRVRFACSGLERGWKLRAEFHSPRFTTRWSELLSV